MRHYLCWLAVLGVILIPTVAAACWPMWGHARYPAPVYGTPMYAMPTYTAPRYVIPHVMVPRYAPPVCEVPVYPYPPAIPVVMDPAHTHRAEPGTRLPPPRVETTPRLATPAPAPAPAVNTDPPRRAPVVEPVRPAVGSDAPPTKDTAPAKDTTLAKDTTPKKLDPPPQYPLDLKFPEIEIPKNLQTPPKSPAKDPETTPVPKVPAVGGMKDPFLPAIPSAAPAPEPSIPPPALPLLPDANKRDPLPSLTLPPDTPIKPSAKTDSTSRSSPLTGTGGPRELVVSVFPAGRNEHAAGAYRTVGFFNHTNRDLALTIEGRAVKLPARSYLHAQLAATFTWGCADRPAARETVPDGAAGLDVVFRE